MDELEAKLAELEAKIQAFLAGLQAKSGGVKGDLETLDQGILTGFDAPLAQVEKVRGSLNTGVGEVESTAAQLTPK